MIHKHLATFLFFHCVSLILSRDIYMTFRSRDKSYPYLKLINSALNQLLQKVINSLPENAILRSRYGMIQSAYRDNVQGVFTTDQHVTLSDYFIFLSQVLVAPINQGHQTPNGLPVPKVFGGEPRTLKPVPLCRPKSVTFILYLRPEPKLSTPFISDL